MLFRSYLIRLYFKEKNIKDEININQKEISIRKYKGNKLLHSSKFSTYWSKVFFTKFKNASKLSIRESDNEIEVATFLHADLKETLYHRIKKFKGDKLLYSSKFNTYWSKVFFTKLKNTSKLSVRESDKETEVATFLHADLKESLYLRIKKQISYY